MVKVSIVVTCYNKEKYIAGMFDSILAQKWNNIEVVMVNDGSIDRTGEIIAEYKTKFEKRGYSVVVISQKNSGVITAAKNGLLACTGNYFCIVDADDKLTPEYVSLPVSFLERHKKFDYTMCNFNEMDFNNPKQEIMNHKINIQDGEKNMLSCYLLSKIFNMPWLYMVRSSYISKDFFEKSYGTKSKGTHEPGFNIPLMALGGKVKVIDKPLYLWNKTIDFDRHSYFAKYKDQEKHLVKYHRLIKFAIDSLPDKIVTKKQKELFILQAQLKKLMALLGHSTNDRFILDGDLYKKEALRNLLGFVNKHFQIKIKAKDINGRENILIYLLSNMLFTDRKNESVKRIICYGVKGGVAMRWLPPMLPLIKTKFQIELWDKNGDGKNVKIPNFRTLKKNDVLFVFPVKKEVVKEIKKELKKADFKNAVFKVSEMIKFLGAHK
jgi:glycosyltransferase involved in cell wall biosynthesis